MKAIKLASVFAVSAVAAAVSTVSFAAAEPPAVFTGTAGLEYKSQEKGSDAASSRGEVNIIGDTGVVYFDMDMTTADNSGNTDGSYSTFILDEIYVTQGAVQFGDFDGSLIDSVAYNAGVEEDNDLKEALGNTLGVRYSVNDSLTVAVEAAEGDNIGVLTAAYETELAGMTVGVAAGYKLSSDDANEGKVLSLGLSAPLGMATMSTFVQVGTKADLDVMVSGIGVDLPLSEQLSVAVQYYTDGGEEKNGTVVSDKTDEAILEGTVYYAVGDVTYYVSYLDYDADNKDYSIIGAKVGF